MKRLFFRMKGWCRGSLAVMLMSAACQDVSAQDSAAKERSEYMPAIHGTVRAKYEYEPQIDEGRFEVRNARVSVDGKVLPSVFYKAEIDLSDEGQIKMLDAYVRLKPFTAFEFTLGQMRVPFTIDAHRSPHQQYFANRSFIAKQVGNVRDVGASVGWTTPTEVPVTIQAGLFNGSGLTGQKNYWTKNYNYSAKVQALFADRFNLMLSCQKIRPADVSVYLWDAGAFFDDGAWHIEGEYLRKCYAGDAFRPVNAVDAFVVRRFPLKKVFSRISALARYDYMSDHSNGTPGEDGKLKIDDNARHRITGGVTLSLGKALQTDIRLNYEKYFYKSGVTPGISDRDKLVVELMCRF